VSLGDLLCGRCFAVLPHDIPAAVDLYGAPICQACHEAEWKLRDEPEDA
jgi:hypothetical protein